MPIITHAISGNAGVANALVSYSGTASGSVTADGSGNYTIGGLNDGSYVITPSLNGYTFSPTIQNETLAGANITGVNFTAGVNMPATLTAAIERVFGSSLQTAYQQPGGNTQNLDLLQIVIPGDIAYGSALTVVLNVDYTGAVHNPAVSPTNGTRLGVFFSNLASTATTAALFASAFANPSQQDIVQNVNQGGNVTYYLNYQGVATGS